MIKKLGRSMSPGPVPTNSPVKKGRGGLSQDENYLNKLLEGFGCSEDDHEAMQVSYIPVINLKPGKQQPRTSFDTESLEDLAESIRSADGIIEPIIVRAVNKRSYEIIAGERRWRAAQILDMTEVPCIIRELDDKKALIISLIENLQRENLNPMEEADALAVMVNEYDMSHRQASLAVGRSRSAVSNMLRLRELSPKVQGALRSGAIEMGHARALIPLEKFVQDEIIEDIINKHYSVRKVEQLVKAAITPKGKEPISSWYSHDNKQQLASISEYLGCKITLAQSTRKLNVSFSDDHDLSELIQWLNQAIEKHKNH